MGEIDFDELDKAVNNLMGDVSQGKQSVQPVAEKNTPVANAAHQVSQSMSVVSTSSVNQSPVPANTATPNINAMPNIATKRKGQFMEMVHPSSDMTRNTVSATPSNSPTRFTSINTPLDRNEEKVPMPDMKPMAAPDDAVPVSMQQNSTLENSFDLHDAADAIEKTLGQDDVTDDVSTRLNSKVPETEVASGQIGATKPVDSATPVETVSPAPTAVSSEDKMPSLDTTDKNTQQVSIDQSPKQAVDTSDLHSTSTEAQDKKDESATTSPFLPDAKVEKRPLGTSAGFDELKDENESDKKPLTMPPEYDRSLLEIEAESKITEVAAMHKDDKKDNNETDDKSNKSSSHDKKTSKASNSENTSSLYDNHTLEVGERKKQLHMAAGIGIIVLSLLIGVALGAAAFFFLGQ